MPETEHKRGNWQRLTHSLGVKLISLLLAIMVLVFALLGYLNIQLHRQHLEASALTSAERVSDVIKRSTTYYMLRNDREGMYHAMSTMADEPGMVRVRIFDKEGRISYSSDPSEVSHIVDKGAEACYGCHTQSQPLEKTESAGSLSHLPRRQRPAGARNHHADRKSTFLLERHVSRAPC